MNNNFYLVPLVGNCVCTEQEKESVRQTVLKLVELVRITRREGLLYLEDAADKENDIFFRSCLRYIVDANPTPRRLHEYVSIWFVTADVSAVRRLEMAIIADGLDQVIMQRIPNAAMRRLGAWLGAEFADRVEEAIIATKQEQRKKREASVESEFDQLLTLSDIQLRVVLERVEDVEIALALMGASNAVAERLETAISSERWEKIQKNNIPYPRTCDVCEVQRRIIAQSDGSGNRGGQA